MGFIGTAAAVSVGVGFSGTRRERGAAKADRIRNHITRTQTQTFLAWFDGLSDADAWSYSRTVFGSSRGSRFADREAHISRIRHAQAF